jgi:hypothetical protein
MIKLDPIYYDKKFRASSLSKLIWKDVIEEYILYYLGILKKFTINITLDLFGCTIIIFDFKYNKVERIEKKISYNHYFFNSGMTSITLDITFNNRNRYTAMLNQIRFFYTAGDNFDPGIVDASIEVNCSIQTIEEFKITLLPSLSREIQYAILRNINGISLESKNRILSFAEFEYFLTYTELSCLNFIEYVNSEIKEDVTKKDIVSIYKQIKGIK